MPLVSAALIVRDEVRDLPRCLHSVRDVVDEIVVVDTGSVDDTRAVARSFGALVVDHPWQQDFSEARNRSLDAASGRWVLVLDADEVLTRDGAASLRPLVECAEVDGFRMIVRNLQPDGSAVRWRDARITRLFRRASGHRFTGRIHEQIAPSIVAAGGRVGDAGLVVVHHGYARSEAQGASRAGRNLALLDALAHETPHDAYVQFQRGAALMADGRRRDAEVALATALRVDAGELGAANRAECELRLAQLGLAEGRDAVALRHARRALAIVGDDTLAWYVRGIAAFGLGRRSEAGESLARVADAADIDPAHRADVRKLVAAASGDLPTPV